MISTKSLAGTALLATVVATVGLAYAQTTVPTPDSTRVEPNKGTMQPGTDGTSTTTPGSAGSTTAPGATVPPVAAKGKIIKADMHLPTNRRLRILMERTANHDEIAPDVGRRPEIRGSADRNDITINLTVDVDASTNGDDIACHVLITRHRHAPTNSNDIILALWSLGTIGRAFTRS